MRCKSRKLAFMRKTKKAILCTHPTALLLVRVTQARWHRYKHCWSKRNRNKKHGDSGSPLSGGRRKTQSGSLNGGVKEGSVKNYCSASDSERRRCTTTNIDCGHLNKLVGSSSVLIWRRRSKLRSSTLSTGVHDVREGEKDRTWSRSTMCTIRA